MTQGTILVVDDEGPIREVCRRTLAELGFEVQAAGTGEKALARLRERDFDLVLTDIRMPGAVDGVRLLEEVKRRCPCTDVVLMTGCPTLDTAIEALQQGAADYLLKPFSQAGLEHVATRCFERRRLSRELDREKLLRRELEAAYAELQKVEQLKAAFLARLQHELRTPLTLVCGVTDMITKGLSREDVSPVLKKTLLAGTARLREVVEQLLVFSDLQSAELKLEKTPLDLEQAIRALVADSRGLWEQRRLKVEVRFASPLPAVPADADLLRTAFKHLLLNAVRFSPQGAAIRIQGARDRDEACVTFADEGIGIPADQLSKIFDSFYQVAEFMTRKVDGLGLGLGLAIVRRIVEAHHGTVSVASREGAGSAFTVRLPVSQA